MGLWRKRTLIFALLVGSFPVGSAAEGLWSGESTPQAHATLSKNCPQQADLDATLGNASLSMSQSRYQDAAALLQPLSEMNCDPRVNLLLAAAYEGQGDEPKATAELRRAHSAWPANNSVAASLAREYLAGGDKVQAVQALAHFHASTKTPEQEMEMAVLVYLAANQLSRAQTIAEQDYKYYPSAHSLLLMANTLQLQGRYPDVVRILGSKRKTFADSAEFFVTLAESEFDASIYPAAREDLEHAISLNSSLYQAHYLLGNVLSRTGNVDGAIDEYRVAIKLAPEQPRTYYQLALALRSKQDETGEQSALEQALEANNHYAPAHAEMGRMLLEEHRPADAVSHLLAAIEDNPRLENAYFQLAKAYAALGEKDKADEIVKRLQAVRIENRPGPNSKMASDSAGRVPIQ